MGHQWTAAGKGQKLVHRLSQLRCALNHLICDAGQPHNFCRNGPFGIHKRLKPVLHLSVFQQDCANFCNGIVAWIQSGGLQVKDNELPVKIPLGRPWTAWTTSSTK